MDRLKKSEGCFIFELEDIYSSYKECLEDLNENKTESPMNRTRFKEKLLELTPHLQSENTSSRRVIFFYKENLADTLEKLDKDNSKSTED